MNVRRLALIGGSLLRFSAVSAMQAGILYSVGKCMWGDSFCVRESPQPLFRTLKQLLDVWAVRMPNSGKN